MLIKDIYLFHNLSTGNLKDKCVYFKVLRVYVVVGRFLEVHMSVHKERRKNCINLWGQSIYHIKAK